MILKSAVHVVLIMQERTHDFFRRWAKTVRDSIRVPHYVFYLRKMILLLRRGLRRIILYGRRDYFDLVKHCKGLAVNIEYQLLDGLVIRSGK